MNIDMIAGQPMPAQESEAAKVDETDLPGGGDFFSVINDVTAARSQETGKDSPQGEAEKKEGQVQEISPSHATSMVFTSAPAAEVLFSPQDSSDRSDMAASQPEPLGPASAVPSSSAVAQPVRQVLEPSEVGRPAGMAGDQTFSPDGPAAQPQDPLAPSLPSAGRDTASFHNEAAFLHARDRIHPDASHPRAAADAGSISEKSELREPSSSSAVSAGNAGDVARAALNLERIISNGIGVLRSAGGSQNRAGVREPQSIRNPGSGTEPSEVRSRMVQDIGNSGLSEHTRLDPAFAAGQRNMLPSPENRGDDRSEAQLPGQEAGNARLDKRSRFASSRSVQSGEPEQSVRLDAQQIATFNAALRAGVSDAQFRGVFRQPPQGTASTTASWAAGLHPATQASALEYQALAVLQPLKSSPDSWPPDFLMQLVERIQMQLRDGENTIRIQLKPSSLGRMEIKAETTSAGILATILTESVGVRDYLEHNLPILQQSFSDQGLKVDRIQISVHEGFVPHHLPSGNQEPRPGNGQSESPGSGLRYGDRLVEPGEEVALDAQAPDLARPHSTFHTVA